MNKYWTNEGLFIPMEEINTLVEKYGQEEFVEVLSKFWFKKCKELPLPLIHEKDVLIDFTQLYKRKILLQEKQWNHKFPYKFHLLKLTIPRSKEGLLCSDYFSLKERLQVKVRKQSKNDAFEIWKDSKKRYGVLKMFVYYKNDIQNKSLINKFLLKGNGVYSFRISSSKALFDHFKPKTVYDFSSGWGDRLIAALASSSVECYIGNDPNKKVHDIYKHILSTLGKQGKRLNFYKNNAENFIPKETYDFVFTSPPYFNVEMYQKGERDETKQSWKKYPFFDSWFKEFLCKSIENAWINLKKGGILAIHLADFDNNKVCDKMNLFIQNLQGSTYFGAIGLCSNSRKGIKNYAEPVWIWYKQ